MPEGNRLPHGVLRVSREEGVLSGKDTRMTEQHSHLHVCTSAATLSLSGPVAGRSGSPPLSFCHTVPGFGSLTAAWCCWCRVLVPLSPCVCLQHLPASHSHHHRWASFLPSNLLRRLSRTTEPMAVVCAMPSHHSLSHGGEMQCPTPLE
jgi:hypothetical protein